LIFFFFYSTLQSAKKSLCVVILMNSQERIKKILKQTESKIPELAKILDLDEDKVKEMISIMEEKTNIKSRIDRENPNPYGYDILYYF